MKRLTIVVPCYNEEEVFNDTNTALLGLLDDLKKKKKITSTSGILYVDDGSKDNTWNLIEEAYKANSSIKAIKFAGNKGHQNAVYAGLMFAKEYSDFTISIDADLQDDIKVIEEMIDKYYDGAQVVYGVRNDRATDSFFKRFTANSYYKLLKKNKSKAVFNSADFRLMSKEVMNELEDYKEFHLFLRGLTPELGFKQEQVFYARKKRLKGDSKYSLKKMIKLAFDGITSSNDTPLFSFFYIGGISLFVALLFLIQTIYIAFIYYAWDFYYSMFFLVFLFGGLILIGMAVLGQYVGRNLIESKKRPRYYIEKVLDKKGRK